MNFPDDLPWMIEYQVGTVVLTTLPRRPVSFRGSSGTTDANVIHPRIPVGCTAWRPAGEMAWRPLLEIPRHWLPFLQRERGTPMDPRPKQDIYEEDWNAQEEENWR
jgi:hypothetical protein